MFYYGRLHIFNFLLCLPMFNCCWIFSPNKGVSEGFHADFTQLSEIPLGTHPAQADGSARLTVKTALMGFFLLPRLTRGNAKIADKFTKGGKEGKRGASTRLAEELLCR